MVQLTLFTHGLCPYAQRAALSLQWSGLPHEVVEIDLSNKPAWYAQRLGTSLVPAVEVDDTPHAESLDIIRLVAELPGARPLVPAAAERSAAVDRLISFSPRLESAGWQLLGGSWSFRKGRAHASVCRSWEQTVETLTASIQKHGGPFLVGDSPSLADAALAPFVARFDLAAERVRDYSVRRGSPALATYLEALEADDGWRRTFPNRERFGAAIERFRSLDYFDFHTSTLAEPMPKG